MQQGQTPKVLNKEQLNRSVPNSTYIGRPSIWGNPFVIGKDGTHADVVTAPTGADRGHRCADRHLVLDEIARWERK